MGTLRFRMSSTSATSATTVNTARMTTPQVMTEPKFDSKSAKRSGLCKPAVASNISRNRPMITTTGAMKWPILRMLTASG